MLNDLFLGWDCLGTVSNNLRCSSRTSAASMISVTLDLSLHQGMCSPSQTTHLRLREESLLKITVNILLGRLDFRLLHLSISPKCLYVILLGLRAGLRKYMVHSNMTSLACCLVCTYGESLINSKEKSPTNGLCLKPNKVSSK